LVSKNIERYGATNARLAWAVPRFGAEFRLRQADA
jgi:hypothetical protein